MSEQWGDALAIDVSKRIGRKVADEAALDDLPAEELDDGRLFLAQSEGTLWWYSLDAGGFVLITTGAGTGPFYVQEWTNPAAVSTTALKAATATTVAPQTILAAALTTQGKADLAAYPRNVTFTSGGADATHAPASATITGTDIDGNALSETVTLSQTAGTDLGIKAFKTITSIVYGAGGGTDATVAIGLGGKLGLAKKPKVRAGTIGVIQEIAVGAVATNGVYVVPGTSGPYGTYAPNSAPSGARSYAIVYERDLT
jgi:hypothetical protein